MALKSLPGAWRVALLVGAVSCTSTPSGEPPADAPAATATETTPEVPVVTVVSQPLARELRLPAELLPYEDVQLHARAQGFVETIGVDIGSRVRRGQVIATIVAPELGAQRSEAEARVLNAEAQRLEAEAQLVAAESTHTRLTAASKTPGVVAGHELELAQQTMEASRARVQAARQSVAAAEQTALSFRAMESYLQVASPFDGVVTDRLVHQGSLVGPTTAPLVRIQQVARLRLAVAIPEADVSGIMPDQTVTFTVPAYPEGSFTGRVARVARALDPSTRSMLVEADVDNRDGRLAPGMFAEVRWGTERPEPSLFVPSSAVVTTTEHTFVVRVREGRAEWVDVRRGAAMDGLVEVFGDLAAGDRVATRGTDEIRADMPVRAVEG